MVENFKVRSCQVVKPTQSARRLRIAFLIARPVIVTGMMDRPPNRWRSGNNGDDTRQVVSMSLQESL